MFFFAWCFVRQMPAVSNNAFAVNKKESKIQIFVEVFFVRTNFVGKYFVFSIILSHITAELSIILPKYLPFSQLHVARFQRQKFWQLHLLLFHFWCELHFLSSNFLSHLNNICFANVFDSLIPLIMLKNLRFKSFVVFFWSRNHLDRSLRVSQLVIDHLR